MTFGIVAAVWGVGGVAALLVRAMWRLAPAAVETLTSGLTAGQWVGVAAWVGFMAYSEGYRGFQRAFSPRVVARAVVLARRPRPLHALLAPLYCMTLVHTTRRRLIGSWVLVVAIVALVAGVRYIPQPWRGIVDAGVVVGLAWGLLAILVYGVRALAGRPPDISPDLPPPDPIQKQTRNDIKPSR